MKRTGKKSLLSGIPSWGLALLNQQQIQVACC